MQSMLMHLHKLHPGLFAPPTTPPKISKGKTFPAWYHRTFWRYNRKCVKEWKL